MVLNNEYSRSSVNPAHCKDVYIGVTERESLAMRDYGVEFETILPPLNDPQSRRGLTWRRHMRMLQDQAILNGDDQDLTDQIIEVGKRLKPGVGLIKIVGDCALLGSDGTCLDAFRPEACTVFDAILQNLQNPRIPEIPVQISTEPR